jgi:hypothetical protein
VSFHTGNGEADFSLRAEFENAVGKTWTWAETVHLVEPLTLKLLPDDAPEQSYTLRLYIDDMMAYTGHFVPSDGLV